MSVLLEKLAENLRNENADDVVVGLDEEVTNFSPRSRAACADGFRRAALGDANLHVASAEFASQFAGAQCAEDADEAAARMLGHILYFEAMLAGANSMLGQLEQIGGPFGDVEVGALH